MITWQFHPFPQLTTMQLYQLLKLRVDVFVVEQECPYPELMVKITKKVFTTYWVIKMTS